MIPHNKFPDQRELLGLNNSVPSGRKVLGVETDSADNGADNLLSSWSLHCTLRGACVLYFRMLISGCLSTKHSGYSLYMT